MLDNRDQSLKQNLHHADKPCDLHDQDCLSKTLHAVGDTAAIAHMAGAHIPGPLKYAGPVAEIISEVIHTPGDGLVEKIVCGTGVALIQEGINYAIAVPAAAAATAAASAATTPVGGAVVGATMGAATYQAVKPLTDHIGHLTENACHQTFAFFENSNKNNTVKTESAPSRNVETQTSSQVLRSYCPVPSNFYSANSRMVRSGQEKSVTNLTTKPLTNNQQNPQLNFKLAQIQQNQANTSTKVSQILGEIHHSYQVINQLKQLQDKKQKEELARDNFQTVMQGFSLISQIGQQTGSRSLERVGTMGLSLAQGAFGVAQLTGAFGVAQVAGFAMAGPIFTIGAAALAIGSTLFGGNKGKRQAKAMKKMFQALSSQIVQVHKDLMKLNQNTINGFTAVLGGLNTINQNLNTGFTSVHNAMSQHFSHNSKQLSLLANMFAQQYESLSTRLNNGVEAIIETQLNIFDAMQHNFQELDFKLDDHYLFLNKMDEKLNEILSDLQELGFRTEIDNKKKMFILFERFEQSQNNETLLKLLQAIRDQLQAAHLPLKSLKIRDNAYSGWFHLDALMPLFNDSSFHEFNFEYANLINLPWAQSAYDCFNMLLSCLDSERFNSPVIKRLQTEILEIIKQTVNPTENFISMLASKEFLTRFFNHYSNQLDNIHTRVEMLLSSLRELNQPTMRKYAKKYLLNLQSVSAEDSLSSLQTNTQQMAAQIPLHVQTQLVSLVNEYNTCIQTFKAQTNIILSLLEVDTESTQIIKNKFSALSPISELHYRTKGVVEVRHDTALPKDAAYSYLDFDTVNCLQQFKISASELAPILSDVNEYADTAKAYLQLMNAIANMDDIEHLELLFLAEQLNLHHQQSLIIEELMKSELNSQELDKLITLMNPVFDVANQVKGKSIVYVIGITGDGKSTLLNCLNGTRYQEKDVLGDFIPERIVTSKPEVCKVGTNIAASETLFPQIIEIPYGDSVITYCDLPGLDGSRDRATTVCEAYAPTILNAQAQDVKGILWVLSADQFRTTRAEKIKEMLRNLLKISKADPKTLAKSITLVVTKGSDRLQKSHVIEKIRMVISGMTNAEENEKRLLMEILAEISKPESNQIIITKVFDPNSHYINEIHQTVSSRAPVAKSNFDFSAYCQAQVDFKSQLENALRNHQLILAEHERIQTQKNDSVALLNLKRSAKATLETQTTQLRANHKTTKDTQQTKSSAREANQSKITALETSTEQVKLGGLKHEIKGLTRKREIREETGKFELKDSGEFRDVIQTIETLSGYEKKVGDVQTHPEVKMKHGRVINAYNAWVKKYRDAGYEIKESSWRGNKHLRKSCVAIKHEDDKTKPKYTVTETTKKEAIKVEVPITIPKIITEAIPAGNIAEYTLSFPATVPVELLINANNKGWNIKPGTENKKSGYHAVITYEQGQGFVVDLDVKVTKKYSEAGQRELGVLRDQKNILDREILSLSQQERELDSQIQKNTMLLDALTRELSNVEGHDREIETELQSFRTFVTKKQSDYDNLKQLHALLLPAPVAASSATNPNGFFTSTNNAVVSSASQVAGSNTASVCPTHQPSKR